MTLLDSDRYSNNLIFLFDFVLYFYVKIKDAWVEDSHPTYSIST